MVGRLDSGQTTSLGEVAERVIAAVLKTAVGESLPRVRIPPSPLNSSAPEYRFKGGCSESIACFRFAC